MIAPVAGLALGLAGSLHCIGMCGPIALALPGKRTHSWSMTGEKLTYQFGRVTTYTVLGALAGIGGKVVVDAGFTQALSIVSGILMIVTAIVQLILHKILIPSSLTDKVLVPMHRFFSRSFKGRGGYVSHFGIGLVNGLLPCGLVMSALMGSIGTGSVVEGAAFMGLFGLGTVPLMSAVAILGATLSCNIRRRLRFATPAIAVLIGVVFILRGLSLGIPMVSPVIEQGKPSCCVPQA
jgi:uncharacterized protein